MWTFVLRIVKRFWGTPEKGAVPPVWLATAPEHQKTNGKYFYLQKESEPTNRAKDREMAAELWKLSAKLARFEVEN